METIVELFKTLPDSQLDASMQPLLANWYAPPTALQVLEVLDHCVHGALASGIVVRLLQDLYQVRCEAEATTHEQVLERAVWRK